MLDNKAKFMIPSAYGPIITDMGTLYFEGNRTILAYHLCGRREETEKFYILHSIDKKDFNGNDIYDGDIVLYEGPHLGNRNASSAHGRYQDLGSQNIMVIIYNNRNKSFSMTGDVSSYGKKSASLATTGTLTVIGNVFMNSDLIQNKPWYKSLPAIYR